MAKILIVTDDAYTYSGREKVCSNMAKIYGENNHVDIFSLDKGGEPFHDFSPIENIINASSRANASNELYELIKENSYSHVFVASMGKLSIFLLPLVFRLRNVKFIACEHVSFSSLGIAVKILKIIALRFYNKVVLLTEYDKKIYAKFKIDSVVIENQLQHCGYYKTTRTYKALAIGRLSKQKNFSQLIDIWYKFKKQDKKNWQLYIAGEGEQKELLENKINKYGLGDNVILLGKVKDMVSLYNKSDVCLMTSKYEGLPLALLEAKGNSLPCIAFDCKTGPSEIIDNNIDGYLVDEGDESGFIGALDYLSNNDNIYFSMSKSTLKTSERFLIDSISDKWNDIIRC